MPAKKSKKDDSFKDFVLDQLRGLPGLTLRPMFGGHGLYKSGRFFGIIYKGQLYFRVSPKTLDDFTSRGSGPLESFGGDAEVRSEEHTSELQSLTHLVCRHLH